jgi:threonine synthase
MPNSPSKSCRCTSTTFPLSRFACDMCQKTYTEKPSSAPREIVPLRRLKGNTRPKAPHRSIWKPCPTGRRWPSRTWRCNCWATCSNTNWARRGETAQHPGRHQRRHRQCRRIRDARQDRASRVFMTSPNGTHEPVPAGADVQPDWMPTSTTLRSQGVFDDCQDIVKAVSSTISTSSGATSIGTVNSINWARLLAQVVYYFAGYFQATTRQRAKGADSVCPRATSAMSVPAMSHGMMGLPIDTPGGGHQRKRRPGRVLPYGCLPCSQQC